MSEDNQNMEELYSFEDVIKAFYYCGLITVSLWEEALERIKPLLLESDISSISLYNKLLILVSLCKKTFSAQEHINDFKNYKFTLSEIISIGKSDIGDLELKIYKKSILTVIKLAIVKIIQEKYASEASNSDNSSDDDSENDPDDDINKIFNSIKSSKEKGKIFSQSISILSNDTQKLLSTPGESGTYLIKIEMTDTRDLKGVPETERWKKVQKKTIFLTDSSKDGELKTINNIFKNVGKRIASVKGVKKEIKKLRSKPY